jgi:cytochrome c biogenesis protein CcmG, thiol:disulfide interchange protein DsbE
MPAPFRILFQLGLILIVGVLVVGWLLPQGKPQEEEGPGQAQPAPAAAPQPAAPLGIARNQPAPRVELPSYTGETFSLASYRGKAPVVLYFFATWWPHCAEESPQLIQFFNEHRGEGLVAAAITHEDPKVVRPWLKKNPFPFPVLYDKESKASQRYRVTGIPVTYTVDREGRVVATTEGFMEAAFQKEFVEPTRALLTH